ncbi:junctional cadherin 5-associated protein isoform X2 [Pleurodeles waltl]|uniref:junctional cadherin 5-associated protein isoform X2 n=1 Tax=Pleurodeles waltl TaxID=8319 RepID=UPI003709C08F
MFSVEDLLISHGYKLPTNTPDPYENKSDGCHYESSQKRAGRGTLNGYETDYGVHCLSKNSLVKGYCSDNEDKQGNQKRKPNTPDFTKDEGTAASLLSSNAGSYGSVPLRGSSRQKTDKDIAHWRRRGQDFSGLLGYNDKGNTRTDQGSTTNSQGTHNPNYGSGTANEDWPAVEGATENAMKKNGLGETSKASFSHKERGFNTETWTDSTKSQNQASENKDREGFFQDSYSLDSRRNALGSQYGKKSSSLPRGFLSENMTHVGQPIMSSNNCLQGVKSIVPYPKNSMHLDLNQNSRTGNSFHNLPKPKYGRPDRPPTYQLHQQTRGTVETDRFQEEQSKAEQNQSTNISEPGNNVCIQESSIEPPVYVPPPSYKSPPGPNVSQILDCGMYFKDDLQHHWERSNSMQEQLPFDIIGSDGQYRPKSCVSFENNGLNTNVTDYTSSVQYIPFDDPRIRHIKMGQEEGYPNNTKETENKCLMGFQGLQGKNMEEQHLAMTRLDTPDSLSNVNYSSVMGKTANNKCLGTFSTSYKTYGVPDHADNATAGCEKADLRCDKIEKHSQKKEDSHDAFENQNNRKTCEAETEIQCRISSRKKMNETIFCLVSVPVTAVLGQPDKDKNNNDFTQSKETIVQVDDSSIIFHEQRFQSSLSTDLERQMPNKNRLEKEEEYRQEEHKHTDDVKLSKPKKHKELRYSGSWPGDHCKDHQSKAIFPHKDRNAEYFSGASLSKQNDANFGPNSAASLPVTRSKKQAGDYGQTAYSINGQRRFTPSIKSAFSRTMSSESHLYKPKTYKNVASGLFSGSTNGKEKIIFTKPEVVKGEVVDSFNSTEPFGQFLLKPANRRPCDAISELEFLNKELQERESDQTSDLLEKDKEQLHDWCSGEMLNSVIAQQPKKKTDYENKPKKKVQEIAMLQTGRDKCKSEGWSNDVECDSSQIFSGLEFPFSGRYCPGHSSRSSEEHSLPKNDRGNKKADNNKNKDCVSSERQESTHKLFKSYSLNSGTKTQDPISTFSVTHEGQFYFDDMLKSFKKESENTVPENYDLLAKETDPRLLSANRNQGLCESETNCLRIDDNSEINKSMCYMYHENQQTLDIPESESLQARASRILGIDVAEDSINAKQSQYLISEVAPLHKECFERERVSGTTETKEETGQNALMEIENCDSNKNSAFKGELNILSKSCSPTSTLLKFSKSHDVSLSPENELVQLKLEKQGHDENTLCQSISSSICQKKAVTPSSERKTRSTSKMIETLQGKLACTPQRTATDRLFRMTEVHSVSRMRRLSIKRSDSGDEDDFEKEQHKPEEEEVSEPTSVSNEVYRKITTQTSAVSKRIISLETPNVSTKSSKKFEDDIFYTGIY